MSPWSRTATSKNDERLRIARGGTGWLLRSDGSIAGLEMKAASTTGTDYTYDIKAEIFDEDNKTIKASRRFGVPHAGDQWDR